MKTSEYKSYDELPLFLNAAMTFAAEADWFFLNGNMAVLTGPRGDQNGDNLIVKLKNCMELQA